MVTLALALPAFTTDRLLPEITRDGHAIAWRASSASELSTALTDLAVDCVLVGAGSGTLTAELIAKCDARGIRIVALADHDGDRHNATLLGFHEVLGSDEPWPAIAELIAGVVVPRAPESERRGVITVWGPRGAPGVSTVAIGIAAELAALGRTVILVDADSYGGAIAPMLGLLDEVPGFASACRLAGSGGLDLAELERIAQRYVGRGNFRVLTGLAGSSRWPELSHERVEAALATLKEFADDIIIDTGFSLERDEEISSDVLGPHRNAATLASLGAADHLIEVGEASPVGLARFIRAHTELSELVWPARSSVVINRVRSSVLGIDARGQVQHTLRRFVGIDRVCFLPNDPGAADAALLSARALPEAAPRSVLRMAIQDLVATEILPAPAAEAGRARIAWWNRKKIGVG